MKKRFIFISLLSIYLFNAQEQDGRVGINTIEPKATLDIQSIDSDNAKGILIPRITASQIIAMTPNLTAEQNALLVYLTDTLPVANRTNALSNVYDKGYYMYDKATGWRRLYPTGLEKITENSNSGWRFIGTNPDNYGNIGKNAVDLSHSDTASTTHGATGESAFAAGQNTTASGKYSITLGNHSTASNQYSTAIGRQAKSETIGGVALGTSASVVKTGENKLLGTNGIAIGHEAKSGANYAIAIGNAAAAVHANALAMGYNAKANSEYSVSIGAGTIADGVSAISIGYETNAQGLSSIAMGRNSTVDANAQYGISMGHSNTSKSNYAVAIGSSNTAEGNGSVALGIGSSTSGTTGGIAMGAYNTVGNNTRRLVVGNGTKADAPKDAFTILTNGKTGIDINNFETNSTSDAKLQVNGSIKVGNFTTCDENNEGVIRFNTTNKKFQGCTGTSWVDLHTNS